MEKPDHVCPRVLSEANIGFSLLSPPLLQQMHLSAAEQKQEKAYFTPSTFTCGHTWPEPRCGCQTVGFEK